jgi:DNA repair protein RadC
MNNLEKLKSKIDNLQFYVPELTMVRTGKIEYDVLPKITSSRDVYTHLLNYIKSNPVIENQISVREMAFVIYLNKAYKIIGISMMFTGGASATVIDTRMVWAGGLIIGSQAIILVHNHPSGKLLPSEQDIALKNQFKEQSKIMDMPIVDFIIISQDGYMSFGDDGIL